MPASPEIIGCACAYADQVAGDALWRVDQRGTAAHRPIPDNSTLTVSMRIADRYFELRFRWRQRLAEPRGER
jgi:hypothetical protein